MVAAMMAAAWLGALVMAQGNSTPASPAGGAADLLLIAPRVRTLDPAAPLAEFVAIRGDRIVAVGPRAEAGKWTGASTRRIELPAGACVLPGFVESHAHLLSIGHARRELDLVGTKSFDEVIAKTKARASSLPAGAWIRGRGWDQNDWSDPRFPEHAALSAAIPDHPVCLVRVDGHAVLANAAALAAAGIDARTAAPAGGEILHDARGEPTGVLVDAATDLVEKKIPPPSTAEDREALRLALEECRRLGITTLHDAGIPRRTLELYRDAAAAGELTTRIYAMLDGSDRALVDEGFARGPWSDPTRFLTVRAIKIYADGALGSRGALLLDDYADRPGHRGLALVDPQRLTELSERALDARFQVCTHAIGDGANRMVLDAYEAALAAWSSRHPGSPRPDHRFRIEHAQILAPADVPRFAKLGVIASMQTCHATSDAPWAVARLGSARARDEGYVWRSLLETGAAFCNGTDAPVEPLSPTRNFYAAVTRLDPGGTLAEPFFPDQRLTRDEALRAATTSGAFAGFSEDSCGMVRANFVADLVALSVDPIESDPAATRAANVELTIVAGRVVWSRR
jgi:predicted amidohydrolase YtcJ